MPSPWPVTDDRRDGGRSRHTPTIYPPTDYEFTNRGDSTDGDDTAMTNYIFTCPDCGQEIEVNASMREAMLASGCPVCTEPVETTDFDPE